jgi:hypothetical protein
MDARHRENRITEVRHVIARTERTGSVLGTNMGGLGAIMEWV